jgi:glycosyltransferase involved in cell wall biosynthesis
VRIVVDVSPLSHPPTGIGNYLRGTLGGLARAAAGRHEILAFAPTSLKGPGRISAALAGIDVETRLIPLPASHALRTAWSLAGRPVVERLAGALDVFHFSDWMYPAQRRGLRATTIHDLVPLRHPEWCTSRTRAMHSRKYANAARTCGLIVANSRYTADDVAGALRVEEHRLAVVHPGVRDGFAPEGPARALGRPYVLGLGTLEPRKNLARLVEAWRHLDGDLALALAGGEGWGELPELAQPGIEALGYVSDDEVAALYRGAAVFVYPSLFEGFGMPIVEAMACGTAVVASSHPSLDEACGTAAIRVDPLDPEAIAAGIQEALSRRAELVGLGLDHARRFTWDAAGEAILRAYEVRL